LLLEVKKLKTYYKTLKGVVKAVDDVTLHLAEREALGLAGESACGKTTLAMSIMETLPPNAEIVGGKIFLDGEEILTKNEEEMRKVRWKKISMIFQSAMNALNPVFKIKDQIIEPIFAHENVSREEAIERAKELVKMVRMDPSVLERYPHELSGGMKQRAVIAMALANYPRIVIADEPTTALDVIVQAQILKLIKKLQANMNLSIILITHDLPIIAEICDKLAIMYAGKIVEYGDVYTLFTDPKHPYTKLMLESFPSLSSPKKGKFTYIPGAPRL